MIMSVNMLSRSMSRVGAVILAVVLSISILSHRTSFFQSHINNLERQIFNSTLGFQKILVLNLPYRTDHADGMSLSAALTGLKIDFIDGVSGADVQNKVLPSGSRGDMSDGVVGSWRAHLNAMAHIVRNNITSALVMEDDTDWDVRIKQQMRDFSRGTRALTQPLAGGVLSYADPTFSERRSVSLTQQHEKPVGDDNTEQHLEIFQDTYPKVALPQVSPYGDMWDVLWPGVCAVSFPRKHDGIPLGRYVMSDDETMLPFEHVASADKAAFPEQYPPRTRIVHHARDPICTFAYAVSQQGARKILYEFGIQQFDRAFDLLMAGFCERHVCLTVQPQLFGQWRGPGPVNRDSDIGDWGETSSTVTRQKGQSENIQRSVRLNTEAMLDRAPLDQLEDQFPSE